MSRRGFQLFYRNNAEGQGSGPLRDALCLLEVTRLKGIVEQAQSIFYTRHSTLILPSK